MVNHGFRRSARFARIAVVGSVIVVAAAVAPAASRTPSRCGEIITDDLTLDQDLACLAGGLVVGADGIKINLNGHSIVGAGTGVGITVIGHAGVTIYGDGTIARFFTAVLIRDSRDVVIKDNAVAQNVDGIDVQQGSRGITIKANELSANTTRGVMVRSDVTDVEVKNNTFTGNRVGVLVNGPTRATVKANFISSSLLAGIRIGPTATDNLLLDNIVVAGPAGIEFLIMSGAGATGNAIRDNTVTANTCGVKGPTAGNTFEGNTIAANTTDFCA